MKIFSLIVAILIWLMSAFGCEPAKPADSPTPTPEPASAIETPTSKPKPRSTSVAATPTPRPDPTPTQGRHGTEASGDEDTLLPEL